MTEMWVELVSSHFVVDIGGLAVAAVVEVAAVGLAQETLAAAGN